MLRKKLVLGMLAATVVTSLAVSQVQAVTGDTNVTYKAGTVGPVDPVDPANPDNDQNNWIVYYPKTVTLTDNNKVDKNKYSTEYTKGKSLMFKVMQAIQGTDGSDKVNEHNVGKGIKVTASADTTLWQDSSQDIKMKQGSGAALSDVIMGIGDTTKLIKKGEELLTLTHTQSNQNGYAVMTNTDGAKDGLDYTAKLTFTFERQN